MATDFKVIPRSDWNAAKPVSTKPFEKNLPIFEILLSLDSGLPECTDIESCKKTLLEGQKKAMTTDNLPDLPFSFVIGPSGEVYEGRGWEAKPDKAIQMEGKDFHPLVYDIGFFGNYAKKDSVEGPELPDVQFKALEALVASGVQKKHLEPEYTYVPLHKPFEPDFMPGKDDKRVVPPIEVKEPVEAVREEPKSAKNNFTYTTSAF